MYPAGQMIKRSSVALRLIIGSRIGNTRPVRNGIYGLEATLNMRFQFWQQGFKPITLAISLCLFLITSHGRAQDFYAGARGGSSFDSPQGHFYQGEAFAGWKTPWRWNFYSQWTLQPVVDVSAGGLT